MGLLAPVGPARVPWLPPGSCVGRGLSLSAASDPLDDGGAFVPPVGSGT